MLFDHYTKSLNPDIAYELNYASVDKAALRVQDFLTGMQIEKNTMLRLRLSVEDVLLRWTAFFPAGSEFHIEMGKRWGSPFVVLKLWGEECDPLTNNGGEPALWNSNLLSAVGLTPVFKYISGCNIVQFPVKKNRGNPGRVLLISAIIGLLIGALMEVFSSSLQDAITSAVLTPLQDAFIRVLNAVSAPVMFLSVLTTVYAVESTSITGRIGNHLMARFLIYSTIISAYALAVSLYFFDVPFGNPNLSQREVSSVLDFYLDVFPGDILSPFINGDFTQLILIALVLGNALLIAGAKAQALVNVVDEAYSVGLVVADWIGSLSPGFVALLIILGLQKNTIHMLLGLWRPVALTAAIALFALFVKLLLVSLRYKVPVKTLCSKMKKSFLISLSTLSVDASYSENQKCCEKEFGIGSRMTAFGLPIGLICFMPINTIASVILTLYVSECYQVTVSPVWMIMALFLAVTLGAAGPPTAGIGILTYTVMFARLGIPTVALTLVLAGDILMSFINYPVNQALLQLELISEADRLNLLNRTALRGEQPLR